MINININHLYHNDEVNLKLNKIMATLADFQVALAAITASQSEALLLIDKIQVDIAALKLIIDNSGLTGAEEEAALEALNALVASSDALRGKLAETDAIVPE